MKEFDITKMNIHNSKSGSFEPSLHNQFEMQSYKLNESGSKSNITLKKMGQELDKAETKCFTLKSELNYMMGVCRKAQTEVKGNKGTSDISLESMSSSKNPNLKSPIEFDHDNEITATNKNLTYNIFQRSRNIEQKAEENFDALHLSPRSAQFTSRKSINNDDIIEKSGSLKEEKQKRLLNVKITPKTQLDKKPSPAIMMMPAQHETVEVGVHDCASREYENSPFCFPEYIREHLQSVLSVEGSIEAELTSKADDYFCVPSSAKRDIGHPELNLDIPDTAKARRAEKSKRGSRMERSESSICKTSDMTSKARKRKGKLRSSISKSTVTTKDTSIFSRKEAKKRRHKGHNVIHQQSNPSKHLKKSNDVVEIFHNTTLKSSNSGMSSKHSKLNRPANNVKRQHLADTANHKIQETLCSENVNPEYQSHNEKNEQNHCFQMLNYQSNSGVAPENVEQDKSEKNSNNLYPLAQCKTQQSQHVIDRYNDPMFVPSYEMPTLSSRLKRSNRSYFSRFNFRNIPFVVGTSVTPSHNLGLNIQQVLSVMKTRQPIANDITPLLIRKVSRGMRPVSSLLEQMSGHCERSVLDVNSQTAGIFNSGENPNIKHNKKLPALDSRHMICKERGDSYDHKIKQSSSAVNKNNMAANVRNQQGISRISLNREDNIGDHKMRIPGSHNSKEIREILINLHDQFEEMNTKYEKLQSEVEKSNDKSLSKELSALEKELNVKEEEINAVVGLYKEVRTLKQQMKMLHEKSSLVCIATESLKETHKNPFPASIISGKSNVINPTQIFGTRKAYNATREQPTSMQLAALLRQIQTFHKQLQRVS